MFRDHNSVDFSSIKNCVWTFKWSWKASVLTWCCLYNPCNKKILTFDLVLPHHSTEFCNGVQSIQVLIIMTDCKKQTFINTFLAQFHNTLKTVPRLISWEFLPQNIFTLFLVVVRCSTRLSTVLLSKTFQLHGFCGRLRYPSPPLIRQTSECSGLTGHS